MLEINKYLGTKVKVTINNKLTEVVLVDAEVQFNQLGLSSGFVHFANPDNMNECLGFCGVDYILDIIKAEIT